MLKSDPRSRSNNASETESLALGMALRPVLEPARSYLTTNREDNLRLQGQAASWWVQPVTVETGCGKTLSQHTSRP